MTEIRRVVDVALDPRTSGSDAIYTYIHRDGISVGAGVFVPLGARTLLGFVVGVRDVDEDTLGFPFSALRPVNAVVRGVRIPAPVMDVARFVSEETLSPLPAALALATPPGIKDKLSTSWVLADPRPDVKLTPTEREVVRVIEEADGVYVERKLSEAMTKTLNALRRKGVVTRELSLASSSDRKKSDVMLRLCPDAAAIEEFLTVHGKRKPAQALTIMALQADSRAQFSMSEVRALAGVTESTVKALITATLIQEAELDQPDSQSAPVPNPTQRLAIDAIEAALEERRHEAFLLFGVTGSGKTEVYLRAASAALRSGRQVLYIVPEIALAAQAIGQLRRRFGRAVAVLHSELSPGERLKNWMRIRDGEAAIIVGARSALFAPIENLGLVILDEEHENAYKQDSTPRYHAKSVALHLGRIHRAAVVLGSATPSVESYFEAEEGEHRRLTLLSMPQRAASATLPEVEIEDLTVGFRFGKPSILSERLNALMGETLARGEQAILFLNRRAYAPSLICRDCGAQSTCPHCAVTLSFHRRAVKLKCHHCGFQQTPPDVCPKCGGNRLNPFGVGTEKVEEAVSAAFPGYPVARLDRDVTAHKGALEQTLANFRAGDTRVLVGTQMVAKGLDFPNVTLVGVIAADLSLNLPDFRSTERTFQLLSQVAGRAGRGSRPGRVVIQTFNPEHPAVTLARDHDFVRMYDVLRQERQDAHYPPFCRLVNILMTGEDRDTVERVGRAVGAAIKPLLHRQRTDLLGPVDCVVERIQGRWRRHAILKCPPGVSVSWVGTALRDIDAKDVQLTIDVDPYSMM